MSVPFSVLMPLAPWEPPDVLIRALNSLAVQSWMPSEVVIASDGLLPEELQQVLASSGLPLQLVIGPGGEGVGPVLDRGLRHCSHEFVVRADADDVSMPQRCEQQLCFCIAHPEVAVLGSSMLEFVNHPSEPITLRQVPLKFWKIAQLSRWRNPMNHPSVVLRRSIVLAVGGYRNCPGFEDYELWLRLQHHGQLLRNLAEPLVAACVGEAHLRRRRGWCYALKEWQFLLCCQREGYFSLLHVSRLAIMRLPLRLLPSTMLKWIIHILLRNQY